MQNEHNPISRKIDQLRDFWVKITDSKPDYKLARWLMNRDDVDLLTGLLKLESTRNGQLPEVFVLMLTPFKSIENFSWYLIKDWIYMYESEKEKDTGDHYTWNYKRLKKKIINKKNTQKADKLLIRMLNDFKNYINSDERNLVLGLIPQFVEDFNEYNQWLDKIINSKRLIKGIKILTLDHYGKDYLNEVCIKNKDFAITLEPGDMDLSGAMRNIATQGNPNDPQVQMRKIMIEMGDAVAKKKKDKLYTLGEELIKIGQRSRQKSFFASVFLIYSGFLMQFKDVEKIDELLDRAIKIAKSSLPEQTDCIPVLIQLYGFKGSNYALAKDYIKTIEWFKIQADFCIEHKFPTMAITAYKNAIIIAEKNHLQEEYESCAKTGYDLGDNLKNEELKQSEFGFIAFHYYKILQEKEDSKAINIKKRMEIVFGPDWEVSFEKIVQQMKSNKAVEV